MGRYGCANYHRRGKTVCKNSITISHRIIEERLLSGLEHMLSEEAFALFNQQVEALMKAPVEKPDTRQLSRKLKAAEKEHLNLLNAIKRGIYTDSIQEELQKVEAGIASLKEEMTPKKLVPVKRILPKAKRTVPSRG